MRGISSLYPKRDWTEDLIRSFIPGLVLMFLLLLLVFLPQESSRRKFEREAIEHGAAVYQADGKFRWVDVVAEYEGVERIGYERGLKAGSAKVFQWAKEKGIELPAE